MRVPLSWLAEFVTVQLPLDELLEVMGRNGLEVEEVRTPGGGVRDVRLARVVEVAEHPRADKLVVVTVDDGEGQRTVCAGARNIAPSDLVPLAVAGATLPDGRGGTVTIDRRDMRGVVSDGMLCSPRELQVADDHAGIMILDPDDLHDGAAAGTDIHAVMPLGEPVIEVAVPADRGDLHSVYGVARDLAAILDVELAPPPDPTRSPHVRGEDGTVPITVDADEGCSRYVGWVVKDVAPGPSPWWLRRRLEVCGIRSLTNLVDVTNYVMLELGQPLHAFDLGTLAGPSIVVRWAARGERLTTLDGRARELQPTDLVIADRDRAVALAGVMGGHDTEVGPTTRDVLLESATFDASAVRRTARRMAVPSQASVRFERGVDPEGAWRAAARAVELLTTLAGGSDAGVTVAGPGAPPRDPIAFDTGWAARLLGLPDLMADDQAALLGRARVTTQRRDDQILAATPPSWRRDLQRPADLAEEVARLYGYEKIPATLPPVAVRGGLTARQRAERDVRGAALAAGFHEAQTYPFVGEGALCLIAPHDTDLVRVENPLQKDAAVLRPSLAEGLLGAARYNVGHGRPGLALCEIGRIFRSAGGELARLAGMSALWTTHAGAPLPAQPMVLGLVAYGPRSGSRWRDPAATWDVYDLLAVYDEVIARLAPDPHHPAWQLERRPARREPLHPGRTAVLRWQGEDVGVVGQLHPTAAEGRDLPDTTVVGELLLEPLWERLRAEPLTPRSAAVLVRHPAVTVDVAVAAPDEISYARIEQAVRDGAGDLLDGLWWFDEFRGEQLGPDRRSLAFHLRLQAPDRQLTDDDADRVIDAVAEAVEAVGATLRR